MPVHSERKETRDASEAQRHAARFFHNVVALVAQVVALVAQAVALVAQAVALVAQAVALVAQAVALVAQEENSTHENSTRVPPIVQQYREEYKRIDEQLQKYPNAGTPAKQCCAGTPTKQSCAGTPAKQLCADTPACFNRHRPISVTSAICRLLPARLQLPP